MPVFQAVSKRFVLICITAVLFCLSGSPASAQVPIQTPILSSTPNFRDLAGISESNGGTGFANTTSNGGVMRTGVIYRSDYLSLSNADWNTISTLHIGRDIDLRTPSEIQQNPDVVPLGATHTNINIYGGNSPIPSPFSGTPANAIQFMQTGYRLFVLDGTQRNGFYNVLMTLANDPGADLYHCSGGKDRTGWTSLLLQTIAGVSQDVILRDYLATNTYTAALMATTKAQLLQAHPTWDPATIDALLGVESSYLEAGLRQVIDTYRTMDAYLTRGLGLTQADIYVLRAKMVNYPVLPGQSGLVGNAASGAALLNALQNSPLSGHYTAFNYYLQSAIEAGSLDGVEARVGGQVHADAASFLLRRPQWIDEAVAPYASGRDMGAFETQFWMAGLGGGFWTNGHGGISGSTEYSAGSLMGATRRFGDQAGADLGIGYGWGSVQSSDASATMNTFLATIGGRYAFSTLESGPYVTARADAGWVDYDSKRQLGDGLGTARGNTDGAFYSGLLGVGDVVRVAPFTLTLQTGVRVTGVNLGSFKETGSDLGLSVDGIDKIYSSLLVDLEFTIDRQRLGDWSIAPAFSLGYERILNNPQVTSTGTLFGFSVNQFSAFDSHNIAKAGLSLTAQHNSFMIRAGVNGLIGGAADSAGVAGQVSVSYSF